MEMFVQTQSFAVLLSPLFEKGDNNATKMESVITLEPASEPCTLALRKNRHAHQHHTHTQTHTHAHQQRAHAYQHHAHADQHRAHTRTSAPRTHTNISIMHTHTSIVHFTNTSGPLLGKIVSQTLNIMILYIFQRCIYIFSFSHTHTHTQPSLPRPALK